VAPGARRALFAIYDETYTTPSPDGVASWLPPGHANLSVTGLLRSGLALAPLGMGLPAYQCFERCMSYSDELHEIYAPPSHCYLWAIGVDPAHHGQGIGSSLLQTGLARGDTEGIACYLDTGTESNVRFYQKHGFQVVEHGSTPKDGVKVWAMLRPPTK
jgi:ribosomal protein S18 acetylase RimI-like enzyme